jgi:hypothetical protein
MFRTESEPMGSEGTRRDAHRTTMARHARREDADPIADGLKRLWSEVEAEEVPEEFIELLDRIDRARDGATDGTQDGTKHGGVA